MDIFIANVPFDEGKGSKIRPALVIKVTSQYEKKSSQIYYPIRE